VAPEPHRRDLSAVTARDDATVTQLASAVTEIHGDRAVVRITGEIDISNAETLRADIEAAIADVGDRLVDLTGVTYINSHGLRMLQRFAAAASDRGGRLTVVAPPGGAAARLLALTGMADALEVLEEPPD
jgi:anti-anti-sigma factor